MGAWGPRLYQDDVALDIKEQYLDLLKCRINKDDASQELIDDNYYFLEDEDDCIPMVLALADIQWKYGKLIPCVKEDALNLLNFGEALKAWKNNPKQITARKNVLNK